MPACPVAVSKKSHSYTAKIGKAGGPPKARTKTGFGLFYCLPSPITTVDRPNPDWKLQRWVIAIIITIMVLGTQIPHDTGWHFPPAFVD